MRRKLITGNWKMNGRSASLEQIDALRQVDAAACDVVICPPFLLIEAASRLAGGTSLAIGAQDCHHRVSGAHTGCLSADMLSEAGARYVIVGHSERRTDQHETDALIAGKAEAAYAAGLVAIVCVGETQAQRDAGVTLDVVKEQLLLSLPDGATAANTAVAYEPVWAIGTGKVPSEAQIAEVHGAMRAVLVDRFAGEGQGMRLLYGGSVNATNADSIFAVADVDGALVGGASLKAADFGAIIASLNAAQGQS